MPKHKILEANPTVRGDILEKVRTGQIKVHRADIDHLTPSGIRIRHQCI